MKTRLILITMLLVSGLLVSLVITSSAQAQRPTPTIQAQLGKMLFFDQNLSSNNNQACAACHAPEVGFTGPASPWSLYLPYQPVTYGRVRMQLMHEYVQKSIRTTLPRSALIVSGGLWIQWVRPA